MPLINITTNLKQVTGDILNKFKTATNPEYLLRPVCVNAIVLIHDRIHVRGEASDGNQIGQYSKGYLAVRSGVFANTGFTKKGKQKDSGTFTDAAIRLNKKTGVFSGEDKVGKARPKYNRGSDPKVIISLTRQLENDYAVIPLPPNSYGVGFNNKHNFEKSQWVQETYDKKIFNLTTKELEQCMDVVQEQVDKAFNS